MFELIRVGIPIRNCDITKNFIDVVNDIKKSTDCIAITTVDYSDAQSSIDNQSAPAGHKILFDSLPFKKYKSDIHFNAVNTLGFIWDIKPPNGMNRDSEFMSLYLIDFFTKLQNEYKFKKIYMLTPGSPHIWDMFTNAMPKYHPVSVIDTYSSLTIVGNAMRKYFNNDIHYTIRHYNMDFIAKPNKVIFPNIINIFGGISNNYNHNQNMPLLDHFFLELRKILSDDDHFLYSTITNDEVKLNVISFKEAYDTREYFSRTNDVITYGIKLK